MKYMIEFELPDNDTVRNEIETADVAWGIWGYRGCTKAKPVQRWIPCAENEPPKRGNYLLYRPHFWGAYKGQITVCYWNGKFWSDNYFSEEERSLPKIDGMFWMPLPPKPYLEGGQDDSIRTE